MDKAARNKLFNDLSALRDEVMWYEDAKGIDGDTQEKQVIDRALDTLLALWAN